MTARMQDGRKGGGAPARPLRPLLLAGAILAGVLLLLLPNSHLVYVAVTSQPDCVPHLKAGESGSGTGSFSAARPAC